MIFENDPYLNNVFEMAHRSPFGYPASELDFYPSSPSAYTRTGEHRGTCIRAEWYKRKGIVGEATDPTGYLIMDSGSKLGELLSDYFVKANVAAQPNGIDGELRIKIERETTKGTKYRISGKIDQLAYDEHGQPVGYEFKTVWSYGKASRCINSYRGDPYPDEKNLMQIALYAHYGREVLGVYDWRLTYVYVEKGIGRTYHVTVDADGNIWVDNSMADFNIDAIYDQYDRLADSLVEGTPPDREGRLFLDASEIELLSIEGNLTKKAQKQIDSGVRVMVGNSPCRWCPFVAECYSEKDAEDATLARNFK